MKIRLAAFALVASSLSASAQTADWTGFYAGAQISRATISADYFIGDVLDSSFDGGGTMAGLYAGYNHQIGNFVLGGELGYLAGDAELDAIPGNQYSDMIDLKARAGYAYGQALPYVVIGWSSTQMTNGSETYDLNGAAYGLGLDYRVSDKVTVGLEYLVREQFSGDSTVAPGESFESDFSNITLRVGYTF